MKRETVTIEIKVFGDIGGDEEFTIPIMEAVEQLRIALLKVPEEYRDTAVFRVWGSGEYVSVYPEVKYNRPETDEELATRRNRDALYEARTEARERAEYERLRAKFSPNNS